MDSAPPSPMPQNMSMCTYTNTMTEQDLKADVEEIIISEIPWTDPDFPPNSESLCQKEDLEKL